MSPPQIRPTALIFLDHLPANVIKICQISWVSSSSSVSPGRTKGRDDVVDPFLPIKMATSSKGLTTVNEMLNKYPKQNAEHALFNSDYVGILCPNICFDGLWDLS